MEELNYNARMKKAVLIFAGIGLLIPVLLTFVRLPQLSDSTLTLLWPFWLAQLFPLDAGFSKTGEYAWFTLLVLLNGAWYGVLGFAVGWLGQKASVLRAKTRHS